MKITLRTLGQEHDITEYVDRPIPQAKSVGDIFNSATLTIPFIKADELSSELDLSYRIPRMSVVEIEDIEDTRQYYVVKADVDKKNDLEYRHDLELKSPEILLSYRPISDYSVTQPVSEGRVYVNEISKSVDGNRLFTEGDNTLLLAMTTESVSVDDSYIENREIKVAGKYKITFRANMIAEWLQPSNPYGVRYMAIAFKVGGVEIHRHFINDMRPLTSLPDYQDIIYTFTQNIANTGELEVFVIGYTLDDAISLNIKNIKLEIIYEEITQGSIKYLDGEVEKLLNLTAVNVKEFWLDEDTRSRLATVKAFDTQDTETTLYEALNKIANYVKAKVRLRLDFESGRKIVWFEFYDDLAEQEYVEVDNDQVNITSDLNEYTSAFELKNNNILKSNFIRETITLRTDDISQITTENIKIITTYPLDRIKKIEISGKEFKDTSNAVVDLSLIDITNRVVLKDYYDTLDSFDRASDRPLGDTQNNHLWFVRGSNVINGLSFLGNRYEKWIQGDNGNRALYETMACVVQEYLDGLGTSRKLPVKIDGGLDDDLLIVVRIEYYTFSDSSAVIHKDDQLGFEEKILRRLNANDRVNNADMLGAYARQKVNAVGGTKKAISGITNNPNEIPKLASRDNGYRVVSVSKYSYDDEVEFIATLVNHYIYESEYVGIDSDRRLYRVSKDDFVDRVDKSLNMLYLSKDYKGQNNTPFNLEGLVAILTISAGSFVPPRIAYLTYDNKQVSKFIDVNALGNTVEFRVGMENNYSAGFKKVIGELNGEPFIYQTAVPYVDIFGTASELGVEYYAYLDNQSLQNFNDYPQGQVLGSGLLGGFIYGINKDAREKSVLSTQIAIMSNEPEVIVYDGLAKFNRQVLNETRDIKMARLHYVPNRDDKFIDISKTDILVNNTQLKEGYVEFNVMYAGNYAWYDNESKELLLVYENAVTGDNRLYFSGVPYEIGVPNYIPSHIQRLTVGVNYDVESESEYVEVSTLQEQLSVNVNEKWKEVKENYVSVGLGVTVDSSSYYLETKEVKEDLAVKFNKLIKDSFNKYDVNAVVNISDSISGGYVFSEEKKETLLTQNNLGLIDVFSVVLSNKAVIEYEIETEYVATDFVSDDIELSSTVDIYAYENNNIESSLEITDEVVGDYLATATVDENIDIVTEYNGNGILERTATVDLLITESNANNYLISQYLTETTLVGSGLGGAEVHSVVLSNKAIVDYEIESDYVTANYREEMLQTKTSVSNDEYNANDLSGLLLVNEDLLSNYIASSYVEETALVSNDLGMLNVESVVVGVKVDIGEETESEYITVATTVNDLAVGVTYDGFLRQYRRDLTSAVNITHDVVGSYVGATVVENIGVGLTFDNYAEYYIALNDPIITTIVKNICQQITLNIENDNDVKVKVYANNIYLGDINANGNQNYTLAHTLNGNSGVGGTYYVNIKFEYQSSQVTTQYSDTILAMCMPF